MSKVAPVEEWQQATIKHLKLLSEDERREFIHKIVFDMALEVGHNGYEIIGLLEVIKLNLLDYLNSCNGECNNCDHSKNN